MFKNTKKPLEAIYPESNTNIFLKILFQLLAIILILALCLGLYFSNINSGFGSSESAGWMQAIGAIFAIAGSFYIANKQSKENIKSIIKSQELTTNAKRRCILSVVGVAKLHAQNIDAVIPEDVPAKIFDVYDTTIINGLAETLSAAPLYEIDSPEAIGALLTLRDQFVLLGRQVEEYIAGPWAHKDMVRTLDGLREPEYKSALDETLKSQKQVLAQNAKKRIQFIYKQINIIEINLISN